MDNKQFQTAPAAAHGTGQWLLAGKQPVTVSPTAVQLFCVPQAGMGAWVYQAWAQRLAPNIQVMPIELPGHGSRMKEPRVTNLCEISCQAVDAIQPHIREGAYALFGHSMGAWIVWEMLQEIHRRGLPLPVRLFVSGNRAPCLHGKQHDVDPTLMHTLTPDKFWPHFKQRYGENKHLEDAAMQAYMYPMLKDDFQVVETYQPSNPDSKTAVPIVAIGGALDKRYTRQQLSAWSQHTKDGKLTEAWLDNQGHNYIADCPHGLIALLRMELGPLAVPQRQPVAAALTAEGSNEATSKADEVVAADVKAAAETVAEPGSAPFWRRCCCST